MIVAVEKVEKKELQMLKNPLDTIERRVQMTANSNNPFHYDVPNLPPKPAIPPRAPRGSMSRKPPHFP